ncbi:MAG: phenylacetate--CoA ligase family protein [Chloroflexi bacterium]|nr:phenylacetate--CoA ligase family protein [Chloroflexota bacterium]
MNILQILKLLSLRRQLESHTRWSRRQLEGYQAEALRQLRRYSCARSPFYRRFHKGLENSPLADLPVLTKGELMQNWDEVVTDRSIRLAAVQEFLAGMSGSRPLRMLEGKYYVVSTAGSTGVRGIFVYDAKEWTTVLASYVRASDWAGLRAGLTRRLKIAIVSTTTPWHQSALVGDTLRNWMVAALQIDSTEPVHRIVARLNDFQPRSLVAYANIARLLAQEQISGALRISPRAVFCASEVLTDDSRKLIERAWGAQPFNMYAATETAGIASECSEHKDLHIYEDMVLIEVVDENNQPVEPGQYGAKLLATVLFSRTLPLIRYEISDSVRVSSNPCTCHCPFALMSDIQGRAEEVVYLSSVAGRTVAVQPNVFHNVMETLPVGGWQVLQERNNMLKVLVLNPGEGFNEESLIRGLAAALSRLGAESPLVRVEYVRSLSHGALGKTYLIKALK